MARHFLGAARELKEVCSGGNSSKGSEKEVVRTCLHRMQQCMSGVRSCIPDFKLAKKESGGDVLTMKGLVGTFIPWTDPLSSSLAKYLSKPYKLICKFARLPLVKIHPPLAQDL